MNAYDPIAAQFCLPMNAYSSTILPIQCLFSVSSSLVLHQNNAVDDAFMNKVANLCSG
jgi:hypothetical protein